MKKTIQKRPEERQLFRAVCMACTKKKDQLAANWLLYSAA